MIGIIIVTGTAFILSIVLVIVDSKLNIKDNSEIYLRLLPGYNCGACGFAGCKGMSEAMMTDINNYKKCRPLRGDKLIEMEEYLKNK